MDIHYFRRELTPHLTSLIAELCLNDGLPFTIDENLQCDMVINDFLLSLVVPQSPSSGTWRTYAEQLSFFFRFLNNREKTWRDATQLDFQAFYRLRRIQDGKLKISSKSWNVFASAVTRFYEWARRNNHIATVPFQYKDVSSGSTRVKSKASKATTDLTERSRGKDIKYMSEEDFRQKFLPEVTKTREGLRNALFVRLLMRSGLRADEAVQLKTTALPNPDDVKFRGRKTCPFSVVGKGNKERVILLPKTWLRDVQRYIDWDRADAVARWNVANSDLDAKFMGHKDYLFLTAVGTPVTYTCMYTMMRTAGEKCGFSFNSHPHMLRHSFAIYQLSAMIKELLNRKNINQSSTGEAYQRMIQDPLRKLQKLMGHASITSTFIYLDYVDEIDNVMDVNLDEESFASGTSTV